MTFTNGNTVFHKLWRLLRTYILTIPRFDLCLQGSLLILILLDSNAYLLLQRDADSGRLPALIRDWVYMGTAGIEFLLAAVIAWWGRKWRNYALSSWLLVTAGSGLLVLAFPYAENNFINVETCDGTPITAYSGIENSSVIIADTNATGRIVMLIITLLLCALTRISIWSHGLTYLDDHEPQNGPYFYGILISIRLSLGLNGVNWLSPGSRGGDWWVAQLAVSMLTLMFAIFFSLFPRKMPQYQEIEEPESNFFASLSRVMRNKGFVLQTVAMSFMYAGLFGFIRYDSFFVQGRFHIEVNQQDPSSSRAVSDIFRSIAIIFFVAIFRVRFSVRRSDGVKANTASKVGGVVAVFVAAFFIALSVLYCGVADITGMNQDGYQPPTCSQECGCQSELSGYSPVCALDTYSTYFSPCHAGCREYENLNGFIVLKNCTCTSERAVRGGCGITSCRSAFSFYLVFFAIVLAFSGASLLMQGMAIYRTVALRDKVVAVGTSFAIITLLANIPGNLLYLLISNLTCAYNPNGLCLFHQPTIWTMGATSAAMAIVSAVISLIASRTHPDKS